MSKIKLAIIRGEGVRNCPFGLPIIEACKHAGESIHRMAPLSEKNSPEENSKITAANKLVYTYTKDGKTCPYADEILENHNKVDCDFGDTGQGFNSVNFRGSPLYPQTFHGIGLDGLYGYPLGYYADNNESRNLFFGLFNLLGYTSVEEIIKLADSYDASDEKEKANAIDTLLVKLESLKQEHGETFKRLETHLQEYREKYESKRDSTLLIDLANKWLNSK